MMTILAIFWSSKTSRNLAISDVWTLVQILVKPEAFFPVCQTEDNFGKDKSLDRKKTREILHLEQKLMNLNKFKERIISLKNGA